jgi:glycosyltransferase involved in cell wall biosynthesis
MVTMNAFTKVRVAHVTATFPPYSGGTGNVAYHNARELVRLGHEVDVFTARHKDAPATSDEEGVRVHRLPSPFRVGNAPLTPSLLWRLRDYDLVHLHYPFYFGAELVALSALAGGPPYIVTYHQDVLFAGPSRHVERVHHRMVGERILAGAVRTLATSWDYARASRVGALLSTAGGRVGVLPNGVDTSRFHPDVDGAAWRERYGLSPTDRVVLFVGALDRPHYFKGVRVLIEAISRLPDPSVKLLVVGEGELRESHQKLAAELGLGARVTFTGWVPDDALPGHYAACDVSVLPSLTMGEAFGVVLLEAMATGRPVVASNLPGVRTVVTGGEDGLLAEPGDVEHLASQITRIVEQPGLAAQMGAAGRQKVVTKYDWGHIGATLEQIYVDALSSSALDRSEAWPRVARVRPPLDGS